MPKQRARNAKAIERVKTRGAKAAARQRYSALEKEMKRPCRRDKTAWADSLADEGEKVANTGDIRLLYNVSHRLSGTKMNATMSVKDMSGQFLTSWVDQLKRKFKHFGNLFQTAIHSVKSNRAPGVDRLSAVMLKADSVVSAQLLHQLFCNIWETGTFPADWIQGVLVKVPKKGDLTASRIPFLTILCGPYCHALYHSGANP